MTPYLIWPLLDEFHCILSFLVSPLVIGKSHVSKKYPNFLYWWYSLYPNIGKLFIDKPILLGIQTSSIRHVAAIMFSFLADKLNVKNIGEILAPTLTPEQQLHAAIEEGMLDKMLKLIEEEKVDPNARNPAGNLPIHTAAYFGAQTCLEDILGRGVDVNVLCPRDNTPLHFAAAQGHLELVKYLVEKGANPALRNKSGRTPYDLAKRDNIRQYLLPLQFRHEDPKQAVANLPPGITPSVDPNAPKIALPPPPTVGVVYSPTRAAGTAAAPVRSKKTDASVYRPIQADGFGSSVGNAALTAKFGNTIEVKKTAPPPGATGQAEAAPVNVYSAGVNPYAQGRYTTYDVHTNSGQAVMNNPGNVSPPKGPGQANKFTVFNPAVSNRATSAAPVPSNGLSTLSLSDDEKPIDMSTTASALQ